MWAFIDRQSGIIASVVMKEVVDRTGLIFITDGVEKVLFKDALGAFDFVSAGYISK